MPRCCAALAKAKTPQMADMLSTCLSFGCCFRGLGALKVRHAQLLACGSGVQTQVQPVSELVFMLMRAVSSTDLRVRPSWLCVGMRMTVAQTILHGARKVRAACAASPALQQPLEKNLARLPCPQMHGPGPNTQHNRSLM